MVLDQITALLKPSHQSPGVTLDRTLSYKKRVEKTRAKINTCQQTRPTLNDTCRLITGCLKPINLDLLYMSAGIAPPPPQIRRQALCMAERNTKPATKETMWKQRLTDNNTPTCNPTESLPAGSQLDWKTWKNLNRIRCHMGRSGDNLSRWGYAEDDSGTD
ncbi:hypothetical protein JTB14_034044 [Gonioctena quinquepunctata]|nr:hypothetical protein JTB14_034044 [Gonioctena quinquepunctata]